MDFDGQLFSLLLDGQFSKDFGWSQYLTLLS